MRWCGRLRGVWEAGISRRRSGRVALGARRGQEGTETVLASHHRSADQGEAALGFVLCKLQAVDVLETSLVFVHLLNHD